MIRKLLISAVVLAAMTLSGGLALAQESTTGTIEGTVTDTKGNPLAGATVTITSAQGSKDVTSDDAGRFRLQFLTSGMYSLSATLQGYNTVDRPSIDVRLGSRVRIEVILSQGVSETVHVTAAAPVVDLSTTTSGATISSDLMSSVPIGRTFSSTLALAPGVVASGIDQANPSINGASGLENTYVVDGVNIGNTGYGSAGSYSITFGSLGTGVNFDYIQEVQIKTGGYEPEFGEALGGFINLVTKTGGNEYRGSVFGYTQSQGLQAERTRTDRVNASSDPRGFVSRDYGFEAGGPIVRDKAFWFAAFDPTFTTRYRETAKALRDAYGFDNLLALDRDTYNYAGNIKWNVGANHTLSVSAFGDPAKGKLGAQRAAAVAIGEPFKRFSEIDFGGHNLIGRWNGSILPSWFAEASVGYHRDRFKENPQSNLPNGTDRRPPSPAPPVQYGGVGFFENSTSTNTQYQLKLSNFVHAMGEHQFRYGFAYDDIGYDHTANYSGEPNILLHDGQKSTSGYIWDIKPDSTFRISRIRTGSLSADTKTHYSAFFVSDTWNPVKSLNIMAGVRYEQEKLIGNLSNHTWKDNWGPRMHVTWDPTQENKSKLSFAWGRFFGKVPNDLAVRALSSEVTYVEIYDRDSVDVSEATLRATGGVPRIIGRPNPDKSYTFGDVPTRIDPDAKLTYQDEFVVSDENEVRPYLNVGVSYTHRKLGRTLEDVALVGYGDLARGADFGEYFITNPTPKLGFPKPSRKYDAVTLKAEKRMHDDWQLLGSYTWSKLIGNYEGYYRRDNGQSDPFITSLFDFPYLKDPDVFQYVIQDGLLPNDRTHVLNLFGSYNVRSTLNVGLSLQVASGVPKTKLGFNEVYGNEGEIPLEPRGASGRGPTTTDVGLHLDQQIDLRGSDTKLHLLVDVFNLFNQQKGTDFEQNSELGGTVNPPPSLQGVIRRCPECANSDFGKPIEYQSPWTMRFAARATF